MGIKSSSDWVMGVGVEVFTGMYLESMMSLFRAKSFLIKNMVGVV